MRIVAAGSSQTGRVAAIFPVSELHAKSNVVVVVVDVRLRRLTPLKTGPASWNVPVRARSANRTLLGARAGAAQLRQRYRVSASAADGAVERRAGRHRTARGRGRYGTRAAELGEASFELYVEAAVEDRVDGAVEQSKSLSQGVDRLRDVVAVLGPDVDEMDHEVRRPAANERTDNAQRHLTQTYVAIVMTYLYSYR